MLLILEKDVKGTGKKGDVVEVKDGFGKNFLIKNNLAKLATNANISENKNQKNADVYHKEQERLAAVAKAKEIEGKVIVLEIKSGENGKVFGSITTKEIAEGFKDMGITLDKRKIDLKSPIKNSGIYHLEVKLYTGISAKFMVEVR